MGLSDLEDAVEALLGLGEGEERVEGGYVLFRSGGFWGLWRGSFLRDPKLDVAVLAERDVVLPLTEGVAFSFRMRFMCSKVYVDRLGIHREGESRHVEGNRMSPGYLFDRDGVVRALQRELGEQLHRFVRRRYETLFGGLPPSALDRLREFAQTEDPSAALGHLLRPAEG